MTKLKKIYVERLRKTYYENRNGNVVRVEYDNGIVEHWKYRKFQSRVIPEDIQKKIDAGVKDISEITNEEKKELDELLIPSLKDDPNDRISDLEYEWFLYRYGKVLADGINCFDMILSEVPYLNAYYYLTERGYLNFFYTKQVIKHTGPKTIFG